MKTFHVIIKLSKSFCVFRIEAWKYCSKLSMQTENWNLKQLCSFAMPNSIDIPSWLLLSSFLVLSFLSFLAMGIFWFRTVSVDSNSKSLALGCCLAFAWFFFQFQTGLAYKKVLLIYIKRVQHIQKPGKHGKSWLVNFSSY